MGTRSSTKQSRCHRTIAGAALAFALAAPTFAFAQPAAPPANNVVIAPKQVGLWTVAGYSEGYCAAERPVPGAAGSGLPLQFVLARVQTGYRIAIAAQHWELKPQSAFPVELIAQPVMRSDTSAMAGSSKLVFIELGADGQFMKKLATVPKIEIKAAQATFTLPMEQFADALSAVESCFGSLKPPSKNPFAAIEAPTKTASVR